MEWCLFKGVRADLSAYVRLSVVCGLSKGVKTGLLVWVSFNGLVSV